MPPPQTLTRRTLLASLAQTSLASALPAAPRNPLLDYLTRNAPLLLRPAQGVFAHPSISPALPGKQYSAELWDWDTLFTARGLFAVARRTRNPALRDQVALHARGSLLNFLDHQSPEGRLPILMNASNPDLLGSLTPRPPAQRDQPDHRNQAKPVMAQLALLIADQLPAEPLTWLAPAFDKILTFHQTWIAGNQTPTNLLVWGDDVAIGNDNDPTTFGRPFFSSANLLLNCLFYQDLRAARTLAQRLDRPADAAQLDAEASSLAHAIRTLCWDPRDAFFYTQDVQCKDRRAELIPTVPRGMPMSWSTLPLRLQTFTGFLPLWCGIASPAQAHALISRNYLADDRLRCASGIRSLSNRESMYSLVFSSNPSNWLGPVWIVVNALVRDALLRYGYTEEAHDLARKTLRILTASLHQDGSLNEYYHPDTGAPLSHKGFMDWNLLAAEMF